MKLEIVKKTHFLKNGLFHASENKKQNNNCCIVLGRLHNQPFTLYNIFSTRLNVCFHKNFGAWMILLITKYVGDYNANFRSIKVHFIALFLEKLLKINFPTGVKLLGPRKSKKTLPKMYRVLIIFAKILNLNINISAMVHFSYSG